MSQYRVDPAAFPRRSTKEHVRYLGPDDKQAIAACYNRFASRTHGMMYKTEREMRSLFRRQENQIVGAELNGEHRPFCTLRPTRSAGSSSTQDEDFHHLLLDPRDGSGNLILSVYHQSNAQGVGLMYRVIDVPRMFDLLAEHNFGRQTCTLELTIGDSSLPENRGSTLLLLEGGQIGSIESQVQPDVEVQPCVADFSSPQAGTVSFSSLCHYGLTKVSDVGYVETLDRLFSVKHKPSCMSHS